MVAQKLNRTIARVAEPVADVQVAIDNDSDPSSSILSVKASDRAGLLSALTSTLRDLGASLQSTCTSLRGGLGVDQITCAVQ